jgi:predicted metal-dependent TIM-barrel fold hydrolase
MSRYAYLEHCWVATMPQHDQLAPARIFEAIKEVGAKRCILATDLGQKHNPLPVEGMRTMVQTMLDLGIPYLDLTTMCRDNPGRLLG